jgi:hypothetical protein
MLIRANRSEATMRWQTVARASRQLCSENDSNLQIAPMSDILIREWQSLEFAQPGRKKVWLMCRTNGPTSYQPSPTGWVSRSPWFGGLKARSKTPLVNHKHRDGPGFQP